MADSIAIILQSLRKCAEWAIIKAQMQKLLRREQSEMKDKEKDKSKDGNKDRNKDRNKEKKKEKNEKEKTNVMRVLDGKKINYTSHAYKPDATMSGAQIAELLNEEADKVFKTLVTQGKSGQYYVFAVPVKEELDLKKAAKAAGEKSVSMIKQKELLPLTGYVHGGCSPVGMKKQFPVFIHETAGQQEHIFVSAGRVGYQIELAPDDLRKVVEGKYADLV